MGIKNFCKTTTLFFKSYVAETKNFKSMLFFYLKYTTGTSLTSDLFLLLITEITQGSHLKNAQDVSSL